MAYGSGVSEYKAFLSTYHQLSRLLEPMIFPTTGKILLLKNKLLPRTTCHNAFHQLGNISTFFHDNLKNYDIFLFSHLLLLKDFVIATIIS